MSEIKEISVTVNLAANEPVQMVCPYCEKESPRGGIDVLIFVAVCPGCHQPFIVNYTLDPPVTVTVPFDLSCANKELSDFEDGYNLTRSVLVSPIGTFPV